MSEPQAIVIGASAGALEALMTVIPQLPANFPRPIIVVVHLPPDNNSIFAQLLDAKSNVKVREAYDKEQLKAGTVYFAPPDYHLLIELDHSLSLSNDEPVLYSRPSIDVLFESAADAYGEGLTGIILTGANSDGAHGLAAIAAAGGHAIVQDPHEALSSPMPAAALKACPDAKKLTLDEIAPYLIANRPT